MDALRHLDLSDAVRDEGFDTPSMSSRWTASRLPSSRFGEPLPDGTRNQTITRADLYGVLRDEAVRRGMPSSTASVWSRPSRRRTASSRTSPTAARRDGDLLIGADGLRSVTRKVIDPHAPAPRYIGAAQHRRLRARVAPARRTGRDALRASGGAASSATSSTRTARCGGSPTRRQPTEPAAHELAAITPEQWRARLRRPLPRRRPCPARRHRRHRATSSRAGTPTTSRACRCGTATG